MTQKEKEKWRSMGQAIDFEKLGNRGEFLRASGE
jgi:hypothetical protein